MRILICGDRNWTNRYLIYEALMTAQFGRLLKENITVVHGANGYSSDGRLCANAYDLSQAVRGADALAHQVALNLGLPVEPHWPDWSAHGKAAGPIRNQEMLDSGIDEVWAFHPDLDKSRGTADMVKRALKANIPVYWWDGTSPEPASLHTSRVPL